VQLTVGPGPRSAAPDTARPPAADPLVWILGGLACLYAGLALVQLAELPGSASRVMAGTAAVSAGCFAGGAGWVAARLRRGRPVPRLVEGYAFVPVVNCLLRLALLEDLRHTSPLTLVIVGLAVAVRSRAVLVAAVISSCAGWVVVVLAARLQGPAALQCALELAVAVALAVLLRGALRRREHQLHVVQRELERTADQFTRIFRDSPVGIGMSDADGHLVAVNPAFCRLVGRPEEELLGATDLTYTHEVDRGEHAATGPRIEAADDRVAHVEKRYVRPDGGVRWAWLSLTHVQPPAGVRGPLTLAHVQDVTDRHDAEEALRESERTLSAVSGVARQARSGEDARAVIMEAVHELAAADTVALVEPDPEVPDTLVVTAARGAEVLGTRIPLSTTSRTVQVFLSGSPVFLADPAADALTSPALLALSGARSMMWQPVTTGGRTTAVLAVTWKETVLSAGGPASALRGGAR
jgi:PAS domain S-box-containing protein